MESKTDRADRLRKARIAKGYDTAASAAEAYGWNVNTYSSNENGNAPFSFAKARKYAAALNVRAEWLYSGVGDMGGDSYVPIRGYVGADTEGRVLFATGQGTGDIAPVPPGGTMTANALEVRGHSMKGFADDGALIYFEEQYTTPPRDLLGHVVIVETRDGEVLVKRLLKGSRPGVFDLESIVGPTLEDVELSWAALVTAIIPPAQARKVIVRGGDNQAA